jgi:outer membrane protein assembly factor BamB/tetratricopeptide (TPR) repeat protein
MRRCRPLILALLAGLGLAAGLRGADAEAELPAELRGKTFKELAKTAADFAAKQLWAEAVGEYQRLIDELGDRLVSPGDRRSCVQVRRLCHARLAALPPEALKLYRSRVDATAQKWLAQGSARHDLALLQRVVDEAFCSSAGADALDLLGDLAFERGRFDDAERWWRLLLPGPVGDSELRYPDPRLDLAAVRAKLLLSRLFRNDRQGWDEELKAFRKLHPKAEGELAGRKGAYADILEALAKRLDELAVLPPDAWPTFAGSPSRNLVLAAEPRDPNRLARLWQFPPWRFDLEKRSRITDDSPPPLALKPGTPRTAAARALAFHPVIVNGQALVADHRYVTAYDLNSGKAATWFDLKDHAPAAAVDVKLPARPGLRCTLTVAEDRVFARLGAVAIGDAKGAAGDSFLVCLDLSPEREAERCRWLVQPDADKSGITIFEGAPAVRDGRAYIAVTRLTTDRAITSICCYPVTEKGTPAPRWRQNVCSVVRPPQPRYQHYLLTLAGPNVVYCSHAGAVVALDAGTGRPAWAFRYPSRGLTLPGGEPTPRDLAPCVYADGRLFVAPADCGRVFCLDPATGQLLWQRDEIEVVHLLGVGKGRLIFTTPKGIRAVFAADGRDVPGWYQPSVETLPPFGRGFLAGELVFWPTGGTIHLLNQKDGQQPDNLIPVEGKIAPGNLAYGDGCLAVADARELRIYAPPARHRAQQAERVGAVPNSAIERYRLAVAEADAGLFDNALENFRAAERLAETLLLGQAERVRRQAQQGRHAILLETARQAQSRKEWERAAELLRRAAAEEFAVGDRLRALAQQADLWTAAGKPEQAVAVWQSILSDEALRRGQINSREGYAPLAVPEASHQMEQLIRAHGRGVYETIEQRVAELLRSAAGERRSDVLDQVVCQFPNSLAAAAAQKELARIHDRPASEGASDKVRLPLQRAWELPLAPSERLLGAGWGGQLFFGRGRQLICREAATGKTCWTATLGVQPNWIGFAPDTVVAAGTAGVAGLRLSDGKVCWELPPAPALSRFQLAGSRLFFVQDGRRLVTLDARTGRLLGAWGVPTDLVHPADRFSPLLHAADGWLTLQTGSGWQWVLEVEKNRVAINRPPPPTQRFTPRPPLILDRERVCLVAGTSRIIQVDPTADRICWLYECSGTTTPTGEPPWIIGDEKTPLVLTERNFGCTAQRLDPTNGKPLWADEPLLSPQPLDPACLALDSTAFYFVANHVLYAYALDDGKRLWERPLLGPPGRWQVRCVGDVLLTYPLDPPADRFQLRWLGASLEWQITRPFADPARRGFPVLLLEAKTGQLLQRLNFTPAGAGLTARVVASPAMALMPVLQRSRPPAEAVAPAVVLTDQGIAVALEGRAWGLRSVKGQEEK